MFLLHQIDTPTLPETNISPGNRPLEKEIPIGDYNFLGVMLNFGGVLHVKLDHLFELVPGRCRCS